MARVVIENVGNLARGAIKTGFNVVGDINREVKATLNDVNVQTRDLKADVGQTLGETQALQNQLSTAPTATAPSATTPSATGGGKAKTRKQATKKPAKNAAKKKSNNQEDISEKPVNLPGYDNVDKSDNINNIYGDVSKSNSDSKPHVHNENCGCANCTDKIVVDVGEESSEEEGENYPVIVGAGSRKKTTKKKSSSKTHSNISSKTSGKFRNKSRCKPRSKSRSKSRAKSGKKSRSKSRKAKK